MPPIRISLDFNQLLPDNLRLHLEPFLLADKEFWPACRAISFPRYGQTKIWDFHCDSDYVSCPPLFQQSNKSFSEVTDLRAIQIKKIMQQRNQELIIFWSGGIDSTAALAAMIKNFSAAELKNITVFANNQSYFENPVFYHQAIEKYQLKTVNFKGFSNDAFQKLFDNYLVVDGEPADKLWIVKNAIQFELIYGAGSLAKPVNEMTDKFIEFLTGYMNLQQAQRYYEFLIQNINETKIEIITLGDLFWWINFNFHWVEHLLVAYNQFPIKNSESYNQYKKNYMPWYNSDEYQLWGLGDRPKQLVPDRLDLYKMPAKQYIYDLVKDSFYLNYKSKLGSLKGFAIPPSDMIILADGSKLDCNNIDDVEKFIDENYLGI
jgi:hypothetical protein